LEADLLQLLDGTRGWRDGDDIPPGLVERSP